MQCSLGQAQRGNYKMLKRRLVAVYKPYRKMKHAHNHSLSLSLSVYILRTRTVGKFFTVYAHRQMNDFHCTFTLWLSFWHTILPRVFCYNNLHITSVIIIIILFICKQTEPCVHRTQVSNLPKMTFSRFYCKNKPTKKWFFFLSIPPFVATIQT